MPAVLERTFGQGTENMLDINLHGNIRQVSPRQKITCLHEMRSTSDDASREKPLWESALALYQPWLPILSHSHIVSLQLWHIMSLPNLNTCNMKAGGVQVSTCSGVIRTSDPLSDE